MQGFCEKEFKNFLKVIEDDIKKKMRRYTMFLDRRTLYYKKTMSL